MPDVPTPPNNNSLGDRLNENEILVLQISQDRDDRKDRSTKSIQKDVKPDVLNPPQSNALSDRPNTGPCIVFVPPTPEPPRILTPPTPIKKELPIWVIGSGLLIVLGLDATFIPYLLHPKLQASSLTIGTLGSPEYQTDLAEHLKERLVPDSFWQFLQGNKIKIVIDGDKTLPYQEAERRIASKE